MSPAGPSPPAAGGARWRQLLDRAGRRVRHDAREAGYAAWLALRRLQQSDDLTFASSIAFYALLSLFPIFLLLFAFIGRVTSDPAAHAAVIDLVLQYFPDRLEFISTELGEAQNASFRLGVAGSLVVVWSALGVFRAISSAVDHAWSVETRRSFLRHQASAFLMLVAAGLVMVAALVVASVAEVMATSWFGRLLDGAPGLSQFTQITLRYPATLLLTVVVSLILYFVPNTTVRVRDIWLGALLTGVLWRLALSAFSWYLGLGGFSVLGSLAAIVVFLLWVYVSAVILLYGVEFTAALARLRRPDRAEAGQAAPLSVS